MRTRITRPSRAVAVPTPNWSFRALTTRLADHRPLIAQTSEYLRLRESSWRLRADALRKSDMATLREAERTEQESFRALQTVRQMRTGM